MLKISIWTIQPEVGALRHDVEVIQMTLSSAKSALENRNDDLMWFRAQILELTQFNKSKKAMQFENLSSTGNEQRGKVQHLLNRIADMQLALDNEAIENMVENLAHEVLKECPDANGGWMQVQLQHPETHIVLPSNPIGIAMDSEE